MKILFLLAALVTPAFTQEVLPKAEIYGGYQFVRVGAVPGMNTNGWNTAVTGNVNRWLGFSADLGGAYKSIAAAGLRAHTVAIGPTFSARGERLTPFAHALAGTFRGSAGVGSLEMKLSGFAMFVGGGLDITLARHVAIRTFEVDWLCWNSAGITERKNARVSAGIVIRL